jgi:hypothetical protein
VLPPRTGGPTPKRIGIEPATDGVEPDIEPEADGGDSKRRRPGPAPQPA